MHDQSRQFSRPCLFDFLKHSVCLRDRRRFGVRGCRFNSLIDLPGIRDFDRPIEHRLSEIPAPERCFKASATECVVSKPADRIGIASRHVLDQIGRKVFVRLVGAEVPGLLGRFEESL